jgi:hypothetical protein
MCQGLVVLAVLFGNQLTAQAARILFVQEQGLRDTAKFIDILRAQGHDLTVLNTGGGDTVDTAANYAAAGYELLIVDEVIGSGSVGALFRNSPIPVINWEGYLYNGNRSAFNADTGLSGDNYPDAAAAQAANSGAGADFGQVMGLTDITITDTGHPLAAGLSGTVSVWDASFDTNILRVPDDYQGVISFIGSRTLVAGVTKVAEVPGFPGGWPIFCVEPGVVLTDGVSTNQARWIHLERQF